METKRLLRPDKPWLHVLVKTEAEATDLLAALVEAAQQQVAHRVVRGHKAKTTGDFFNELSAALQFPSYFGENWDAFDECLNDLEWLPGDAYVILITRSNQLLEAAPPEELHLLWKTLEDAGQEWSQPLDGAHTARPFHVLLQCGKNEEAALQKKLHSAKVSFDHLN